jgi:Beta-propeller repeat
MFRRIVFAFVVLVSAQRAGDVGLRHRSPARGPKARGETPILFERNDGQAPVDYRYIAHGTAYEAAFGGHGVRLALVGRGPRIVGRVTMDFVGSRDAGVSGDRPLASRVNYFRGADPGAWHVNVPTFGRVRYSGVYDGIDAVFYGADHRLEYDLIVAPRADPAAVVLRFAGADDVTIDGDGDLIVHAGGAELIQHKPVAYQERDSARVPVDAGYRIDGDRVRLSVGAYDVDAPLVIDPVIASSTLLGGTQKDQVHGMAIDASGALYVTGQSSSPDFPAPHNSGELSETEVFVCKLSADLGEIVYCTRFAGADAEFPTSIAVDSSGHAYVAGSTISADFPTTPGAFSTTCGGCPFLDDGFVMKLADDGASIVYSTFLGGSFRDFIVGIGVDAAGRAHVAGTTNSRDFPVTPGAFQQQSAGSSDAFATMLTADGTAVVFSTYLGGKFQEEVRGASMDAAGNMYLAGITDSPDLPVVSAVLPNLPPPLASTAFDHGFFARVDSSGALTVCSYFGGERADSVEAIVGAPTGIFLGGRTDSPSVPGRPGTVLPPHGAAFLSQLTPDGSQAKTTRYFDGDQSEVISALAIDGAVVYAVGSTTSIDFPTTASAPEPTTTRTGTQLNTNAFYMTVPIEASGTMAEAASFSTYLGGLGADAGRAVATDGHGGAYVGGIAGSDDFPAVNALRRFTTGNPIQDEGFITHFVPDARFVAITPGDIVVWAADAAKITGNAWEIAADPSAAGGRKAFNPDHGAAKVLSPLADPASYVEMTFNADAGTTYHMWIRGRAQNDFYLNDSAYAQFTDSVDPQGNPIWRIGTTSATAFIVEPCIGCIEKRWAWRDDGYGGPGHTIRFANSGQHTVRFQQREDGVSIDQVLLSSGRFLNTPPETGGDSTVVLPRMAVPPTAECTAGEVVMYTGSPERQNGWNAVADATAAGGVRLFNPDAGAPKLLKALAMPANAFDLDFTADAQTDYRLWLRGIALNNFWGNDSVFVQFSDSVDGSGAATWRMGTTSATAVNLEDCSGCGLKGWGWQDNGWGVGVMGPVVRFASSGSHSIRVQVREDGLSIDQIVLSASTYLNASPGQLKNDTTILRACATPPLK